MPIYTRIITSLSDFIILIDEILTKYGASVFVEDKTNDGFINKLVITDNTTRLVKSNRDKNLNFFITTLSLEHENRFNFYDDAQCKFVIEGKGGRENATELEMLQLANEFISNKMFIGYNIDGFDFPYLRNRMRQKYQMNLNDYKSFDIFLKYFCFPEKV